MAINKRASNININITKKYISVAQVFVETANQIIVYSTDDDLLLNSNKKIIVNGNRK